MLVVTSAPVCVGADGVDAETWWREGDAGDCGRIACCAVEMPSVDRREQRRGGEGLAIVVPAVSAAVRAGCVGMDADREDGGSGRCGDGEECELPDPCCWCWCCPSVAACASRRRMTRSAWRRAYAEFSDRNALASSSSAAKRLCNAACSWVIVRITSWRSSRPAWSACSFA